MTCCCATLEDFAVVPMGGDGLDERVFASIEEVRAHGGERWWLYIARCTVCGADWMIAQDSRIYDNHYLKRISPGVRQDILAGDSWPEDFLTYERVLRLGRATGQIWQFVDPRSPALVGTAEDLRLARPDITTEEIAYLLGIPVKQATRLSQ